MVEGDLQTLLRVDAIHLSPWIFWKNHERC